MGKQQPIGIFDSGVGGTSIWREIHSLLPMEQTLYLADSANAPYGEKSKQEIIDLSVKNTRKLLEMDSKIIVVACNTAEILPQGVKIIDSGLAVANQTKNVLENLDLLADDQQCPPEFFTNADPEVLKALVCAAGEECRVSYLEF